MTLLTEEVLAQLEAGDISAFESVTWYSIVDVKKTEELEARERFPEFRKAFEEGKLDAAFGKFGFDTRSEGYEHMWDAVDQLDATTASGKVANDRNEPEEWYWLYVLPGSIGTVDFGAGCDSQRGGDDGEGEAEPPEPRRWTGGGLQVFAGSAEGPDFVVIDKGETEATFPGTTKSVAVRPLVTNVQTEMNVEKATLTVSLGRPSRQRISLQHARRQVGARPCHGQLPFVAPPGRTVRRNEGYKTATRGSALWTVLGQAGRQYIPGYAFEPRLKPLFSKGLRSLLRSFDELALLEPYGKQARKKKRKTVPIRRRVWRSARTG